MIKSADCVKLQVRPFDVQRHFPIKYAAFRNLFIMRPAYVLHSSHRLSPSRSEYKHTCLSKLPQYVSKCPWPSRSQKTRILLVSKRKSHVVRAHKYSWRLRSRWCMVRG